jgi:Fe-S cluster biogenesis protein NfuA
MPLVSHSARLHARVKTVVPFALVGAAASLLGAGAALAQPSPPAPSNTVGQCPSGTNRVGIASVAALMDASRGDGAFADDPPNTCYLIANGTYQQSGSLLMYVLKGGSSAGARYFVGATRQGVVIQGRAAVENGVSNVVISNLTFDLAGYSQSGSFSTLTLNQASNVTVSRVTFTGDCATGSKGGHIETDGVNGLLLDSVLVEKFGHCASGGHEDHGIYLAAGANITVRNSIVRGNASRGIQMYTAGGDYGTLRNISVRSNWIYRNGHGNYEDGILVSATGAGTISNVVIDRNLIYRNYYSGIRFVGDAMDGVSVRQNTFDSNGAGSTSASRSEVNLDDVGSGAGAAFGHNIFRAGNRLVNDCYDSAARGFSISDNVLYGQSAPSGAGNCVGKVILADPQFVDAANGDYHTRNPVVAAYGAYGGSALVVAKAGNGGGTVTSSPSGISCGSDCSQTYTSGTVVALGKTAAAGSAFVGWSGACSGTGACQVTMSAAKYVTATFVPTYALTVTRKGTGSGTVASSPAGISCGSDCSQTYRSGTIITLSRTAAAGSAFAGWSGACSGTGACQVTMSSARSVTATFVPTYTLTVTKRGTGKGTVTSTPSGISCGSDCSQTYRSGTVVTLGRTAAAGSAFVGWSGACSGTGTCQVTMSAAKSVTASFASTATLAGEGPPQ